MRGLQYACLALLFAGCAPDRSELVIGAAASLSDLLPALTSSFEEETGIALMTSIGASGMLARQIRQGAPIDVFLAADEDWVDALVREGYVLPDSRAVYARGRLVLWSRNEDLSIASIHDLASPQIGRIAVANPDAAPYGRAAVESMRAAGIFDRVQPRLIIAEHVRQTLQFAETGNVDVAFVPATLAPRDHGLVIAVPETMYSPLNQTIGAVAAADSAHARRFVAFVLGARGRTILERHGFVLPPRP